MHNKDLSSFDAIIMAYISQQRNEDHYFKQTNEEIAKQLRINIASLPNVIDKLYKLGLIDITHEQTKRIIIDTYDAPHKGAQSGYIYIMKDATHNFLKLGFSKDPKYRESTLQGERPTIELVAKYKGTMSQEQECHRRLARFRKRGEWFEVDLELAEQTIKKVTGIL